MVKRRRLSTSTTEKKPGECDTKQTEHSSINMPRMETRASSSRQSSGDSSFKRRPSATNSAQSSTSTSSTRNWGREEPTTSSTPISSAPASSRTVSKLKFSETSSDRQYSPSNGRTSRAVGKTLEITITNNLSSGDVRDTGCVPAIVDDSGFISPPATGRFSDQNTAHGRRFHDISIHDTKNSIKTTDREHETQHVRSSSSSSRQRSSKRSSSTRNSRLTQSDSSDSSDNDTAIKRRPARKRTRHSRTDSRDGTPPRAKNSRKRSSSPTPVRRKQKRSKMGNNPSSPGRCSRTTGLDSSGSVQNSDDNYGESYSQTRRRRREDRAVEERSSRSGATNTRSSKKKTKHRRLPSPRTTPNALNVTQTRLNSAETSINDQATSPTSVSAAAASTAHSTLPFCGVFQSPCTRALHKTRKERHSSRHRKAEPNDKAAGPDHPYIPPPTKGFFPNDHFWLPNEEVPARLEELNRAPIMPEREAIGNAWNENDSSQNIIVIDNGYTLHRHPVAQSTDAIRGKMSYASGMHAIEFVWEHGQRGTHAVLGVCTKNMRLERPGYCSLIGNDQNGWGWDITRNRLFHNGHMVRAGSNLPITSERENGNSGRSQTRSQTRGGSDNLMSAAVTAATLAAHAIHQQPGYVPATANNAARGDKKARKSGITNQSSRSPYPPTAAQLQNATIADFENGDDMTAFYPHGTEDYVISPRIIMIIDCDEGWVGFCNDGKWLGIAFSTLRRANRNGVKRLAGPLYPCISCVWGNCEVSMKPLCSIAAKPLSLTELCRKSLWRAAGGPARGFFSTEQMCKIIHYEEQNAGLVPDKLKRYLLAPTKHSLPSKILADEYCRGNYQCYLPIKSDKESSLEPNMEAFTTSAEDSRPPRALEYHHDYSSDEEPESRQNAGQRRHQDKKDGKYNLRSRRARQGDSSRPSGSGRRGSNVTNSNKKLRVKR